MKRFGSFASKSKFLVIVIICLLAVLCKKPAANSGDAGQASQVGTAAAAGDELLGQWKASLSGGNFCTDSSITLKDGGVLTYELDWLRHTEPDCGPWKKTGVGKWSRSNDLVELQIDGSKYCYRLAAAVLEPEKESCALTDDAAVAVQFSK